MIEPVGSWRAVVAAPAGTSLEIRIDPSAPWLVAPAGVVNGAATSVFVYEAAGARTIVALYYGQNMGVLTLEKGEGHYYEVPVSQVVTGLQRLLCTRPGPRYAVRFATGRKLRHVATWHGASVGPLVRELEEIAHYNYFTHKAGVLLYRSGYTTEEELFNNTGGGRFYYYFLGLLGELVTIDETFDGYLGGLDQKGREGASSVYAYRYGHRLMYHVGTLMRHVPHDDQYVGKKKHIGNDHVVIVFYEDPAAAIRADVIRSSAVLILVAVQNLRSDDEFDDRTVRYRINVAAKSHIHTDRIAIPDDAIRGREFSVDEAAEFIFRVVIKCIEVAWETPELSAKLRYLRYLKIDGWR